jgi:hypothetical protein
MNRGWTFVALCLCLAGCGGSDDSTDVDARTDADVAEEVTTPDVEADGPGDVDATPEVEPDVEPDVPEAADEVAPEVTPDGSEDGVADGPGDATAETFNGVECGPTLTCMPPDELCCARGFGGTTPTFECIAAGAACDEALVATCDGPEDCEGVCCMTLVYGTGMTIVSATTACSSASACGGLSAVVICRLPADCPTAGALCCTAPPEFGLDSGYCWSLTGTCPY